ncbi:MAG TPA: hypothetical protein PLI13_08945, partial [Paracoccus sp. (in: a-proteobacteria)]|nr:hypothetical protein [Paracoccus sp. (in: a-proteobacteria)]
NIFFGIGSVLAAVGAFFSFTLSRFADVYTGPGLAAFFWWMLWLVAILLLCIVWLALIVAIIVIFAPLKNRGERIIGGVAIAICVAMLGAAIIYSLRAKDRFGRGAGEISQALRDYSATNGKAP